MNWIKIDWNDINFELTKTYLFLVSGCIVEADYDGEDFNVVTLAEHGCDCCSGSTDTYAITHFAEYPRIP